MTKGGGTARLVNIKLFGGYAIFTLATIFLPLVIVGNFFLVLACLFLFTGLVYLNTALLEVWIGINSFTICACAVTFLFRVTSVNSQIGPVKSLAVALYLLVNIYYVMSVSVLHQMIRRQTTLQNQILGSQDGK